MIKLDGKLFVFEIFVPSFFYYFIITFSCSQLPYIIPSVCVCVCLLVLIISPFCERYLFLKKESFNFQTKFEYFFSWRAFLLIPTCLSVQHHLFFRFPFANVIMDWKKKGSFHFAAFLTIFINLLMKYSLCVSLFYNTII